MAGMLSLLRFRHRSGRRGKFTRLLWSTLLFIGLLSFLVFVIVPIVYRYSPQLQRYFLFLNTVGDRVDFTKPEDVGLPGTRNFYVETEENIAVGIWHILPEYLIRSVPEIELEKQAKWFEGTLTYNQPIIFYLHGNKGSRGQSRRVELYGILRQMGYHVITFDYRGYADSSPTILSEEGLVTDAKVIISFLMNQAKPSLVYVWGHSLGTGVACHAVSELCLEGKCPGGLILESPFNNIVEEVRRNPLTMIFRGLPYFDWAFVDPLEEIDVQFKSDEHITRITTPILILHAEDDNIVPFDLGKKLQIAGQKKRSSDLLPIKLVKFEAKFGYGHNHISRAPELTSIVKDFVKSAQKFASNRKPVEV